MASFHKRRKRSRDAVMGPRSAGRSFRKVLSTNNIDKEVREHRLLNRWSEIVGPRVAKHTVPDSLKNGVLWIRVDSSPWMHQLSFLKEEIRHKANSVCEKPLVSDVRFHLGRTPHLGADPLAAAISIRPIRPKERPLPPPARGNALMAIEDEASQVEDEELREAIIEVRKRIAL